MKLNKKVLKIVQNIIIVVIFFMALRELYKIFIDIDINLFNKYAHRLTLINILIIAVLGVISYMPLSFYDLVIRKRVPIDMSRRQLYKYSWIMCSSANFRSIYRSSNNNCNDDYSWL